MTLLRNLVAERLSQVDKHGISAVGTVPSSIIRQGQSLTGVVLILRAGPELWQEIEEASEMTYPRRLVELYAQVHRALQQVFDRRGIRWLSSEPLALARGLEGAVYSGDGGLIRVQDCEPARQLMQRLGRKVAPYRMDELDCAGWYLRLLGGYNWFSGDGAGLWATLATIAPRCHQPELVHAVRVTQWGWNLAPQTDVPECARDLGVYAREAMWARCKSQ